MRVVDGAADREVAAFHAVAFALAGASLALGASNDAVGWGFALGYNLGLPAFASLRGRRALVDLWVFLFPLSLLQIVPDWFLVAELGVLEFANASGLVPVPLYMGGLWTAPLLLAIYVGERTGTRRSTRAAYGSAAGVGFVLFAGAELLLTSVGFWSAVGVTEFGGAALYILPAETILCTTALFAYRSTRESSAVHRLLAAALTMLVYLGAACAGHLVAARVL